MDYIMVKGRPVYIFSDTDFADVLQEEISESAKGYFLNSLEGEKELAVSNFIENPLAYCHGECDKVYETQRHYTDLLRDIMEELDNMYEMEDEKRKMGCDFSGPAKKRVAMINKIQNMINKEL